MKKQETRGTLSVWLLAAGLALIGAMQPCQGAAPALNGKVVLRPFTATDRILYSMPTVQISAGLNNVGLGEPVYLDALVNAAITPSNIVGVAWTLTAKPLGSQAALTNSPLSGIVDIYLPSDKYGLGLTAFAAGTVAGQIAGRSFLRPDVVGQYTVVGTIAVVGSGTNSFTNTVTAATFVGVQTCEFCHSGSVVAPNIYSTWTNTAHASVFARSIDGNAGASYSLSSIPSHTLGYDTNSSAVNGGFDDLASQLGWTFPAVLTNGNWAGMQSHYPSLANLANVQCENCHGPGSQHVFSLGILGNTNAIAVSLAEGTCAQCHDSALLQTKSLEWKASLHARTSATPTGPTRSACVRCHATGGFIGYINNLDNPAVYATNTAYGAIDCQACHDPHDASHSRQLRTGFNITLGEGTSVTNAGSGGFCMNCHRSRNGSVTNSIVNYPLLQTTWNGGSSFGPHDSPQGDMLEGVNGWTYGQTIPSSAHRFALTNTCATCHMQQVATSDPAFGQAGGHTFHMSYTNNAGVKLGKVDVCIQCHGPSLTSFDYPVADYNGDGVIEGVQTEVSHLLDKLSTLLPNSTYVANGNYAADGLVKTSISTKTNWPAKFLKAGYNWQFVANDSSLGVHNAPYAVGLLKASIGDLNGDANNDGLPDAWQIQYFGSATAPAAAPAFSAAGDGIPNWLKYNLGLSPLVAGTPLPTGVIQINGRNLLNSTNNTTAIYTAAEVAFDTAVGTTYQIQGISNLMGGWQNIGSAIAGTGTTVSYLTVTRTNTSQFFRVIHTP